MKSIKINTFEFCSCLFTLFVSSYLGMTIYSLIQTSKNDAIISVLLSIIPILILLTILLIIYNYKSDLSLRDKLNTIFNKPISTIIIIIISLCLISYGIFITYDINNFIISQFLSETPIFLLEIIFSLVIIYINSKGIEVIVRVSNILFIINIFLILIAIGGQLNNFDINNFKPILENGITIPLKGIIYICTFSITPLFTLLSIPKDTIIANKKINKFILIFTLLGILFFLSVTFFTIGVLGKNLAILYQYPAYMILKRISLFGFLDRIENIVIIQWIFQVFICDTLIVYFIKKELKIKSIISSLIILIVNLLIFKNNTLFNLLSMNILPYICLGTIGIFLIISIFIIKKKA